MAEPKPTPPVGYGYSDAVRDALGLVGVGSASYGAWLINPAYGYMLGGVMVFMLAIVGTVVGSLRT